jgi:hypothetical protein
VCGRLAGLFTVKQRSRDEPSGSSVGLSSRFKVQCSRSETNQNVEPGTLNFEHPYAFAPPSSPLIETVSWFFLGMNKPD